MEIKLFEKIQKFLESVIAPLEWIMLILIIGGGVYLTIYSKGYPLLKIKRAFNLLFSKDDGVGISRFQSLSAVLAATVGLGNISGVSIAIHMGGPGVIFWMWITAIIGSTIKFYSCSLSVIIRKNNNDGYFVGGPMYYMNNGIKKFGKPMAIWFSVAGLFGVLPAFTANQLTETFVNVVNPSNSISNIGDFNWKLVFGIILSVITSFVIFGGLKSIVKTSSRLVPVMVIIYLLIGILILVMNIDLIIPTFNLILSEAFNIDAVYSGGLWGLIILGVRRAVFSNEGGVGSAAIAHSAAKTDEPVREGIVAMIGPFIDTIIVCFMTASVILITSEANPLYKVGGGINGAELTSAAFGTTISWFPYVLSVVVFLFSFSTMISWYYYGDKGWKYLFGPSSIKVYQVMYLGAVVLGAIASLGNVIDFSDMMILSCAFPNIIGCLFLLPILREKLNEYWTKYNNGEFKVYK